MAGSNESTPSSRIDNNDLKVDKVNHNKHQKLDKNEVEIGEQDESTMPDDQSECTLPPNQTRRIRFAEGILFTGAIMSYLILLWGLKLANIST